MTTQPQATRHHPTAASAPRWFETLSIPVSANGCATLLLFIQLFAGWCPCAVSADHGFAVRGVLTVSDLRSTQASMPAWQHTFRIQSGTDSSEWCIEDLTARPRAAFTLHGDVICRTDAGDRPDGRIEISSYWQGYPMDLDAEFLQLWTAFCSAGHLRNRDNQWLPVPYGDLRLDLYPLATRAVVNDRATGVTFPTSIDFLMDHELLAQAAAHLKLQSPSDYLDERAKTLALIQQLMPNGSLAATFRVASWQRVDTLEVPTHWVLRINGAGGVAHTEVQWVTGDAVPIQAVSTPSLPAISNAVDKRTRDATKGVNYVIYPVTNGIVPDVESAHLAHLVGRAARGGVFTMPPDVSTARSVGMTVLGLLLTTPLALLFARKTRSENPNNQR